MYCSGNKQSISHNRPKWNMQRNTLAVSQPIRIPQTSFRMEETDTKEMPSRSGLLLVASRNIQVLCTRQERTRWGLFEHGLVIDNALREAPIVATREVHAQHDFKASMSQTNTLSRDLRSGAM